MGTRSGRRVVAWRARMSKGSIRSAGAAHSPCRDRGTLALASCPKAARSAGVSCLIGPSSHSRRPTSPAVSLRPVSGGALAAALSEDDDQAVDQGTQECGDQQDPDQADIGVEEDEPDPDSPAVVKDECHQQGQGHHRHHDPDDLPVVTLLPVGSALVRQSIGSGHHPLPPVDARRAFAAATVPGMSPGAAIAQLKSRVAWWAKSRMGPGTIPNTTLKATETPMTKEVSQGTGTAPRSVTANDGGASVSVVRLETSSDEPVERSPVPSRTASPESTASPAPPAPPEPPESRASPTAPTGEYMATATRR